MSSMITPQPEEVDTYVEIKLTIKVPPFKVNEVTESLLHVLEMKDVFNGKLEQGRVEINLSNHAPTQS